MRFGVFAFALLVACQSGAPVGAICERNSQCSSPLVCTFGRCRTECVEQRDCPAGTLCLLDQSGNGSCALMDDPDCTTSGCASPLACVGRACVNVCSVGVACPPGSDCVPIGDGRARCVRADEDAGVVDDAGSDAGTDANVDAGPRCTPMGTASGPCDTALDVSVSDGSSCVRTTMGHLWCWGALRDIGRDMDTSGCTLMTDPEYACPHPSQLRAQAMDGSVGVASDVAEFDMQDTGGCFVTRAGMISCWGTADYESPLGRLDVSFGERARPIVASAQLPLFDRVIVLGPTAIAIAHDRTHWWGWGLNTGNVLMLTPAAETQQKDPIQLTTTAGVDFDTIATGPNHACGIASGVVSCWGTNDLGQADPANVGGFVAPRPIPATTPMTNPRELVVGARHACVLVDEGLVCWGAREYLLFEGQAGTCAASQTTCPPTLVVPPSTLHIAHLWPSRNSDDVCATDMSDALYCWGQGYAGRSEIPPLVPGLPPVASAAITYTHACALTTDSDVWCWGLNETGELGLGTIGGASEIIDPMLVRFE